MPTPYTPPIDDMMFTLDQVVGYSSAPSAQKLDIDTLRAVLDEAGKLAADVLAPINWDGDQHGAKWAAGNVTTAPGWRDAYAAYRDGGWNAVPFPEEFGGQGLPWAAAFPVQEMWQAANMSFGLCPLLNQGAVEAILHHGSDAQRAMYLPNLVSGVWTGTMNLTEPGAGSDLGALKTRAEKQADGTYRIFGQKIFITYGEHDLADNIIHLVLARVSGAPDGPKGISLFIVPKFIPFSPSANAEGPVQMERGPRVKPEGPGIRNDVTCVSVEHKLGIHASPTCTMQFGDAGGAVGELVGAENEGLKYMFTMMNNARLSVGLQGVAMCDRATQAAVAYANDRVQGKDVTSGALSPIAAHADVRRMILTMRAMTMAARAITYDAAVHLDRAGAGDAASQDRVELLTPIVKSFGTDAAVEVASLGIQVHGGMGFIEETGAAQFYRDARILPIYEGTNGIQAMDLVFRKVVRNGGASVAVWVADLRAGIGATTVEPYIRLIELATAHVVKMATANADVGGAMATPYARLMAVVAGGAMMARVVACTNAPGHMAAAARFYVGQILPLAHAYYAQVIGDIDVVKKV
jgi:alkylation response protein AidB-like acyl-CoA dehydrogenase